MTGPRRPRRAANSELVCGGLEFLLGAGNPGRCARCQEARKSDRVPAFDHEAECGCSEPGYRTGFHPDDSPCTSMYPSPEAREAAWRRHGAEILADRRTRGLDRVIWPERVYGPPT